VIWSDSFGTAPVMLGDDAISLRVSSDNTVGDDNSVEIGVVDTSGNRRCGLVTIMELECVSGAASSPPYQFSITERNGHVMTLPVAYHGDPN
jgi:hypothetical protein